MSKLSLLCALLLSSIAWTPATAKVFFRVTATSLPPSDKTAIDDLVLPWPLRDSSIVARFRNAGYTVWLQCDSKNLASVSDAVDPAAVAGVIVAGATSSNQFAEAEEIRSFMAAHKNLSFRILVSGGKQPQMKGRLVVERDGILQVSSPSTQPWLDTNLAAVRIAHSSSPDSLPIAYDFRWSPSDVPPGAWYPDAEDYALAIAESDAVRSDVIIDLPASLQQALNAEDPQAWSLWKRVMPYLGFSSHAPVAKAEPIANLGVIVDNTKASYEPINLLARHSFAFEALRPANLTLARLQKWNSVVVFSSLNTESFALLQDFATKGGIVVFVNSHDKFPWHSIPPSRQESRTTTYSIGAGQIVELGEPVIEPENFARDLRRLIGRDRSAIALWNSLTTIATAYREEAPAETTLYLVNYADQPDNVQIQVKGRFTRVRFEAPEEHCCVPLPFVERNGFTEFTIPSLRIAARVHLDSDGESSAAQ